VYLRFQLMRGHLSTAEHAGEVARVRAVLGESGAPHWQEFAAAWAGE
jgi:hypothetical protein